ncbi:hypothetical protein [Flavobacterium lindanitolerans]|uniref:hypothetical protein n=1 Tax=Flavobacterium lindanitolerans TaxID=428988 RepID=UPI0023F4A4FC|nr:hypothetical protein [Flavobacterium lindanitolerans]
METKCYLWEHKPTGTKYLYIQQNKKLIQIPVGNVDWAILKLENIPEIQDRKEILGLDKKYYINWAKQKP